MYRCILHGIKPSSQPRFNINWTMSGTPMARMRKSETAKFKMNKLVTERLILGSTNTTYMTSKFPIIPRISITQDSADTRMMAVCEASGSCNEADLLYSLSIVDDEFNSSMLLQLIGLTSKSPKLSFEYSIAAAGSSIGCPKVRKGPRVGAFLPGRIFVLLVWAHSAVSSLWMRKHQVSLCQCSAGVQFSEGLLFSAPALRHMCHYGIAVSKYQSPISQWPWKYS